MNDEHPILKQVVPDGVNVGRVILLPDGPNDQLLIASLERTFAADDGLDAVAVHWDSRSAYVLRGDFLDALSPEMRSAIGWGDADHVVLPGKPQLDAIVLRCPIDGEQFDVFFLDPIDVRFCPTHVGTRLEVA